MRRAGTSPIFAFPWRVSVTIPAWEPVSDRPSKPRSSIAISASAHEMRSPTEMSMSSARGFGAGEISYARRIRSSVVLPIADRTPTTRLPLRFASTSRRATAFSFSGSPTDVPPNFITTVPACGAAGSTAGTSSYSVVVIGRSVGLHLAAACESTAESDLVRVLEIAADRKAAREAGDAHAPPPAVGGGGRGRLARHVRVGGEHHLLDPVLLDAPEQLVDPEVLRLDAVERRERAAEHVVEAPELVRALQRDQVDRLLDDADDRVVAPRIDADRAQLLLGQVPALAAEAHAFLHLLDRSRKGQRLVRRNLEQVKRKSLRGSSSDPGKPRELRDEVVHSGAEHGSIVPASIGGTYSVRIVTVAETHIPSERLRPAATAALVGVALVATGGAAGAYFPQSWGWSGLFFLAALGLVLLLAHSIALSRLELAFLGALAAFTAWVGLSTLWSQSVTRTLLEVERDVVYVAAAAALLALAPRCSTRLLLGAVPAAGAGICAWAL